MRNYRDCLNYLYALEKKGVDLGLDRMQELLKRLGNPEKKGKFIHVAGTNGKGSVTAMISSILKEAGFKVGTYVSPHLVRFTERMIVDGKEIDQNDVTRLLAKIEPHIKDVNPTFFEAITAMAFLYFAEKKVDYTVLEVGLGGRLDATNVIVPKVSVITNIGLEHQEYLGNSIKDIAKEKAGIIKPKVPVVTLATADALKVIKLTAAKSKSRVIIPTRQYPTNLAGEFQEWNAALAVSAFKALRIKVSDEMLRRGLGKLDWPGRMQTLDGNILVDCAHNAHAALALATHMKGMSYDKLIIVFGVLQDKNVKEMLRYLRPMASMIILTKASYHRALAPQEIGKELKSFLIQENVADAVRFAKNIATEGDLILVTGSCYVVGDAISALTNVKSELTAARAPIPHHKRHEPGRKSDSKQSRPPRSRQPRKRHHSRPSG